MITQEACRLIPIGQYTITSGTAVPLSSSAMKFDSIVIQAEQANTASTSVCVGDSSVTKNTGFQLNPGQAITIAGEPNVPVDASQIYLDADTTGCKARAFGVVRN